MEIKRHMKTENLDARICGAVSGESVKCRVHCERRMWRRLFTLYIPIIQAPQNVQVHYFGFIAITVNLQRGYLLRDAHIVNLLLKYFLTHVRLCLKLLEPDTAHCYSVFQSTTSRIFTTWINFLYSQ